MTDSIKDYNFGGYLQVGGTSLTVTIGSDGITLGIGGQLSVGYTISGTTNINYSLNNGWTIQPSVMQGVGTPTGMPGVSVSLMRGVDAPTYQVQVGAGWNDLIEVGVTGSVTQNSAFSQQSNYNFGPNYRGKGFTDPRILDNSGGFRGMNTYSGVYASQAAENAAFEQDWNTATNAYSMKPSYTSFPTNPAAYNGYSDAFGGNSSSGANSSGQHFQYSGPADSGGNTYFENNGTSSYDSYDSYYDYDSYDYAYGGGGWYPLVIDLDGDGVEIKPLDRSTTTFDIDNDGYKERTAWVGADDGMLVIDLNGDNQITQSKEMAFGEWTTEQDTDLQALAKVFDSNGDGTFDSRDARFNEFRIWKDANSNGVADAGEMMTLQEAGIAANGDLYRKLA